jgi:membrane protease YdiL (CAAX protease family)
VHNPTYPPGPPTFGDATAGHLDEPQTNPTPRPIDPDNPSWGALTALFVWFVSIVLMFLVPVIFFVPYLVAVGLKSFDPLSKTVILLQVVSLFPTHVLTFVLVWLVVTNFRKQSFAKAIGWGWARGFRLWSCIGLGILLFIVGSILAKLLGAEKTTPLEEIIRSSLAARYMISFLAVCTAPFVEEFVYRGVLYAALRRDAGRFLSWLLNLVFGVKLDPDFKERMGMWAAVFLVLALFTIIHVPQYWPNFGVIAAVALLSVVLTVVRAYSGKLLPCIVIHIVFNGIQAIILILEPHLRTMIPSAEPAAPNATFLLPLVGLIF